ncbi:MAG: type I DNA topoisomerase [Candidatus Sungbacteria bacterium]|nr:type I DNA topoisomerase [bacterium]MDZ4260235.1 type I DNA topoisomerase [Candidatus Sungbacteria bacterium]
MSKKLVIVESPTKARTISRFIGSDFIVESSFGHIRDLPTSTLGVDVEHNFEPHYIIPAKARPVVKKLKELAKNADEIILASDEDREGEAIAWHLVQALGIEDAPKETKTKKKTPPRKIAVARIVFHEITKKAIEHALKEPRPLDLKRVDAQQARRILDRLVGYKLSPFLWKKVYRGLSAGRVQSVAVRLIVEREREIQQFKPQEYWSIIASLQKRNTDNASSFDATLTKIQGETIDKFALGNEAETKKILDNLAVSSWRVSHVEKKAVIKNPATPFTTSTLQQDAFRRLGFSAKQTMRLAQQLYEGIELGAEGHTGLITYMRTDSLNLSEDAIAQATDYIKTQFGPTYVLPSPRRFKTKTKGAQEAHEAIRPTDPSRHPDAIKDLLDPRQFRLYNLIWRRFMATQMPQAIFDHTTADILANDTYTFRVTGQVMKFDGFLKAYPIKVSETQLPELIPQEELDLRELKPLQHFTEPPARFSEATLVKILEQHGIGRPSTYAPIISTVQDRGYVEKFDRRYLKPTEVGFLVNDILVEHFPQIVDIEFTATMERQFDEIAQGEKEWQPVIKEFYEPFAKNLEKKYLEVKKHEITETTDEMCEKCSKPMVVKLGRFGKFLACSGFPECKTTKTIKQEPKTIGMKCPKCIEGDVIMRFTKRKKLFYGCSRYPACDWASWTDPRIPQEEKIPPI